METLIAAGFVIVFLALCIFANDNPVTSLLMLCVMIGVPIVGLLFLFG